MWKVTPSLLRTSEHNLRCLWKRFFLSDAYPCQEYWDRRMTSPEFKSLKIDHLRHELDHQFQHFAIAPAIEIDLFANLARSDDVLEDVEDILHKFRLSPNTLNMLPSTHHAIIRYYLANKHYQTLIRILGDKLGYGIFPDDHSNNLLLDLFLKKKMYREAAKIASLQMQQESFDHPITKYLSLYSCLKYLEEPSDWHEFDPEPAPEPEEDVKVRVAFLVNPFFDDHFDLKEANDSIGKTLWMIGKSLNDSIGNSCVLYGLVLRKKFDKAEKFIDSIVNTNEKSVICKDILTLVKKSLENHSETVAESEKEEFEKKKAQLVESLKKLENLTSSKDLLLSVEDEVKKVVAEHEVDDIQKQCKLYDEWEKERVRLHKELLEERERQKRLAEVNQKLRELDEKEEELYFFRDRDIIEMKVEEKRKEIAEREEKLKEIKKDKAEEYIPPEIVKVYPSQGKQN